MNQSVEWLNSLPNDLAEAELLKCCGSKRWAERMAAARPFSDLEQLLSQADEIWRSLETDDWLEAFRAHPKIGEKKAAAAQTPEAQSWSAQEQSAMASASAQARSRLADLNEKYEELFGFIFIVCATGKSPAEMLAMLERRMLNDRQTELRMAAEEQRKITRLRLAKLTQ